MGTDLFSEALTDSKQRVVTGRGMDPVKVEAHVKNPTRPFANRALGDTLFRLAGDSVPKIAWQARHGWPTRQG
ncbi:MAG: hypothetical protein PVF54_08745 [Anaerolineae bacterium]